ncbi:hypothetical protein CTZ27_09855 [Streptomyces griseocarneus]|nr:hypothetical protein CTZ27_09855 [Streptomyces griseocarneus]
MTERPRTSESPDPFTERLGDRIDDRVAESFDELYAEWLAEGGPFQRAVSRERRIDLTVAITSLALGTLTTILASGEATVPLILWAGLAVLDVAYFFRPRRLHC